MKNVRLVLYVLAATLAIVAAVFNIQAGDRGRGGFLLFAGLLLLARGYLHYQVTGARRR